MELKFVVPNMEKTFGNLELNKIATRWPAEAVA